ncbi:retron St85 family RNA-directed DNA polymerase [Fodinibius halophilus]|uniref:RNA-directed DNA polymerase n=1 Tax=Fodinibius halophilus TaxID=1736908 RepID=A0A6M1TB84_9BACT|nr:retron St85 family RNA-directed DNA polymerase [Fodinibius halophilus]NGP89281.1 RNA-directed DNA polymerase [Fodinibius halophilus]
MSILKGLLSKYTSLSIDNISNIIKKAPASYKTYRIEKANGGYREINHPAKETKTLQYALMEIIFKKNDVHPIAMAYKRGVESPTFENARLHKDYEYSLRLDFKNFFPSIKPDDIISIVKDSSKYEFDDTDYSDLKRICFRKNHIKGYQYGLAVGAPTSPIISNIVMYDFDEAMEKISKELDKSSTVTRYADDIVFSTNEKGICAKFYSSVRDHLNDQDLSLEFNEEKTAFMSRGTKKVITGLVISNKGNVSIGYDKKEKVKRKVYKYSKGDLEDSDILSLKGYLAYIQDVDPDFFDKLNIKYGADILDDIMSFENE